MSDKPKPIQPTDLLGWVITYGEHHQHCMFVASDRGETAANLAAAHLHGEKWRAIAESDNDPEPARGP